MVEFPWLSLNKPLCITINTDFRLKTKTNFLHKLGYLKLNGPGSDKRDLMATKNKIELF